MGLLYQVERRLDWIDKVAIASVAEWVNLAGQPHEAGVATGTAEHTVLPEPLSIQNVTT